MLAKIFEFSKANLTKMRNAGQQYGIGVVKAKKIYLEVLDSYLKAKKLRVKSEEDLIEAFKTFTSDDYRQIWYEFTQRCEDSVSPKTKKAENLKETRRRAKEILNKDLAILKVRIEKINKKLERFDRTTKIGRKLESDLEKYEEFYAKASSGKATAHFTKKLLADPDIESFIFK